ncbi:MAG: hypothetical protein AB8B53_10775 [Flavobacteriales bacterium]
MKKNKSILVLFSVAILLSSCSLFRKKNKCNTCPTWDQIENVDAKLAPPAE